MAKLVDTLIQQVTEAPLLIGHVIKKIESAAAKSCRLHFVEYSFFSNQDPMQVFSFIDFNFLYIFKLFLTTEHEHEHEHIY
jgi:hypothetical protein